MEQNGKHILLFIWDKAFSKGDYKGFEELTKSLERDYSDSDWSLIALTADKINKESFDDVIAAVIFSNKAHVEILDKISQLSLDNLPVIFSMTSSPSTNKTDEDKFIRACPSAKTVGQLLAMALYKKAAKDVHDNGNIVSFFLPDTAKVCADAFKNTLSWIYPNKSLELFIDEDPSVSLDDIVSQYKDVINFNTTVVIYGFDGRYYDLFNLLIEKKPKRIISDFNTPDDLKNSGSDIVYICFESPFTGAAFFKKLAITLIDTLRYYNVDIKDESTIKAKREKLRTIIMEQSHFRKTAMGTFHFTENNDFFAPFYLKQGGADKIELIEGVESFPEVAVTALSECNKHLEKFSSSDNNALHTLISNISIVLSDKLYCNNYSLFSKEINKWYPDNSLEWKFMFELPRLFHGDTFWGENNKVKHIQISLRLPDLEDCAASRVYVDGKQFLSYLFSEEKDYSHDANKIAIAKCIEDTEKANSIRSSKEQVNRFVNALKKKCKEQQFSAYDYLYFIFLRQANSKQHFVSCFLTKEKLGLFELTILENITTVINSTILGVAYKDHAEKESIKSAKAAIMSRNMSHNLGSHVMAYLKQKLRSVEDIVKNNALSNFINYSTTQGDIFEVIKTANKKLANATDIELPFLVGLGRFMSYLQERQDYIATISTDYSPYYSAVNFKDFIYDELNPDHRYTRHKDRSGCKPDNILLSYIAMSEGLERGTKNDIVIKFREFNGTNHDTTTGKTDLDKMRDYDLSLPGGVVGRQAIFSIFENIIRNAAKHGNWKDKGKLELTIDILTPQEAGFLGKEYQRDGIEDMYVITITDNLDIANDKLTSLKAAIEQEDYVNESGEMLNANKGIKEMRISAGWLRGGIADEKKQTIIPVLRAERTEAGNLQYIFCVPRAKKVAIITANESTDLTTEKSWDIISLERFKTLKNKCYELLVATNENIKKGIADISPNRLIVDDKIIEEIGEKKESFNYKVKFEELYKKFVSGADEKMPEIIICDGKAFENNKTNKKTSNIIVATGDGYKGAASFEGAHCIYRTHHQSEAEFNKFMEHNEPLLGGFEFIEGISGHNSTDRLVRNDALDTLWYYRHLHAMKTRVAIIDERLFTLITGVKEIDLKPVNLKQSCIDIVVRYENIKEIQDNLTEKLQDKKKQINKTFTKEGLLEIVNSLEDANINCESMETSDHMNIVYEQKGISVFTTFYDEKTKKFSVWGYKGIVKNNETEKYKAVLHEVAEISKANNGIDITIKDNKFANCFDYVSIHQGLLDKIYNKFEYKTLGKEEGATKQREVTHKLYMKLIKADEKLRPTDYLPGLIIHSGRSRPSLIDMPQEQPFIQYAAIEHALLDCKFSLVELLDFAQVEPIEKHSYES